MPHSAPRTVLRRALGISLATLASRVLGFGRDILMGWLLGGTLAADALVIALRLPQVMRRLFAEGALSLSLTADLHMESRHGCSPAAITRAVQWRLALLLACAVLAGEALAAPLTRCLAPGATTDAPLVAQATELLRVCLPYTLTAGMAALGMARLHQAGRFLVPALMPLVLNTGVLLFGAVALWQHRHGTGTPQNAALLLATGLLCGGVAQWLCQYLAARRLPAAPQDNAPVPPRLVRRVLAHLPLGILGAAAPQLAMLGAMIAASWLAQGSMAALYYAERLMELPLGLAGAALGMASLPALTELALQGDLQRLTRTTAQTLCLSLCLTLPAMTGLMAVSAPLIHTLFPTFDAHTSRAAVLALWGYAPGIPAYGLTRPLLAAAHALGLRRFASYTGLTALGAAFPASLLCMWAFPAEWQMLGPALGVSLGLTLQSALLCAGLHAHLRALSRHNARSFAPDARLCAAATVGALCTGAAAWGVTLAPLPAWGTLAIAVFTGAAVYAAVLLVSGSVSRLRALYRNDA